MSMLANQYSIQTDARRCVRSVFCANTNSRCPRRNMPREMSQTSYANDPTDRRSFPKRHTLGLTVIGIQPELEMRPLTHQTTGIER